LLDDSFVEEDEDPLELDEESLLWVPLEVSFEPLEADSDDLPCFAALLLSVE
jgi:hypothetical protein